MTYLAVPISAENIDAAGRQIEAALSAGAQMLELRTDYLQQLSGDSVKRLILQVRQSSRARVPVIVTCRDPREGGAKPYPEETRLAILLAALEAGADFIDFEYANFARKGNAEKIQAALSAHPKSRLILSAHDFKAPFTNIHQLYRDIVHACPEAIPKLVYTANHINDCFDAFDLLHETSGDRIVLCMGGPGLISRILAKKLGAFVTFASIDEQAATAPGQLTIATLKGLYRYDIIDADTELFGVIGDPVGHSLSPAIHNACFADLNMNKLYLPLHVQGGGEQLDKFLDAILARPWLHFHGFSVTIPHKHSLLQYVHSKGGFVEPLADKIGAANTLIVASSSWRGRPALVPRVEGVPPSNRGQDARDTQGQDALATAGPHRLAVYNTDYPGALDAITAGMGIERKDLRDVPVAVIGAGGVSRAIVAGLTDAGARITIYNRTVERAKELAADFGCEFGGLDALPQLDARLLVNCTSIGMHPNVDATPVPAEYIKPDMMVFDTVYNPAETLLLKQAKAGGAKTIDGITMFVNQAAAQFRLFTGQKSNTEAMRETAVRRLWPEHTARVCGRIHLTDRVERKALHLSGGETMRNYHIDTEFLARALRVLLAPEGQPRDDEDGVIAALELCNALLLCDHLCYDADVRGENGRTIRAFLEVDSDLAYQRLGKDAAALLKKRVLPITSEEDERSVVKKSANDALAWCSDILRATETFHQILGCDRYRQHMGEPQRFLLGYLASGHEPDDGTLEEMYAGTAETEKGMVGGRFYWGLHTSDHVEELRRMSREGRLGPTQVEVLFNIFRMQFAKHRSECAINTNSGEKMSGVRYYPLFNRREFVRAVPDHLVHYDEPDFRGGRRTIRDLRVRCGNAGMDLWCSQSRFLPLALGVPVRRQEFINEKTPISLLRECLVCREVREIDLRRIGQAVSEFNDLSDDDKKRQIVKYVADILEVGEASLRNADLWNRLGCQHGLARFFFLAAAAFAKLVGLDPNGRLVPLEAGIDGVTAVVEHFVKFEGHEMKMAMQIAEVLPLLGCNPEDFWNLLEAFGDPLLKVRDRFQLTP
jgi:3-dehydroquinate dehydratase/shikimate dehydrogenase